MFELLLVAVLTSASPPCDAACEERAAVEMIEQRDLDTAVDRLRSALKTFPEQRNLHLLLAKAYMASGNLFWAERSLMQALERWPDDLEIRSWLASVHLRQGDPDLIARDLANRQPDDPATASRFTMLEASRARLAGDDERATSFIAQVPREAQIFPEDYPLWLSLQNYADPWHEEAVTGFVDTGVGWTSNALAGAPTDPGASGESSPRAQLEIQGRFAPPVDGRIRPSMELHLDTDFVSTANYRELSSLDLDATIGAAWISGPKRMLLNYRPEVLYLNQNHKYYSSAHRLEAEFEDASGPVFFFGGGHREYRDEHRTRWEMDGGLGGPLRFGRSLTAIGGLTLRYHDAETFAYDMRGASAVASAHRSLGRRLRLRLTMSASYEDYFKSGGAESLPIFRSTERRKDLLGRLTLTLWTPPWRGLHPKIEIRYTDRNSTIEEKLGYDFNFHELRLMATLRWNFSAHPWAPETTADTRHIELDWGLENGSGWDEERILDLLRHDEELRRGASCGIH